MGDKPRFGQWMRGIYASDDNPQKEGMYVRTKVRFGKLNPGIFYELTDGLGKFWEYPKEVCEPCKGPEKETPARGGGSRG